MLQFEVAMESKVHNTIGFWTNTICFGTEKIARYRFQKFVFLLKPDYIIHVSFACILRKYVDLTS